MYTGSQKDGPVHQDPAALHKRILELEAENRQYRLSLDELERAQDFSKTVLNSMSDAVYVVNADDYSMVDCNQVFLDRYGYTREQVIGHTCYEVKSQVAAPCNQPNDPCPTLSALETGHPFCMKMVLDTAGGERMNLECTALPIIGREGRNKEVVLIERDITPHKSAQAQLRKANLDLLHTNAYLTNLIKNSVDAVIAADMTGRIKIFNAAAAFITGYSEKEALEQLDIRQVYPEGRAKEIMKLLRRDEPDGRGKLKNHEVQLLTHSGMRIPISLSASVVYVDGEEMGTVGFFYDLREKKKMERELDHTRVQLLQAEKMASIGKLAAGVAHQLNNPLSGITLFAHILLEEYDLEDQAIEDINRILHNAERSRETVRELLQFSRQTTQETTRADINDALSRTLFLLQDQSVFQNIEIVRELADGLPDVPADLQQLNHVFMNLVLNAADAMENQGEILVRTSVSEDGDHVRVEISDTGPGIPEEVLPQLFEPFFTTKEEGKGTGLGLSVAYGVIADHQGNIWAQNRPEGGASFIFELPIDHDEPMDGED